MSFWEPSHAPHGCTNPMCVHLEINQCQGVRHDRCRANKPMHNGCGWHKTSEQVIEEHNMGQVLSHTEAFFIAQHVRTNIRELEGAFKKVLAYSRFKSQPISLDLIQEALKDVIASHQQSTSVSNIMDKVAQRYGVSVKDLVGDARFKKFTGPRQVAMALCKELTKMSFPEIAKSFGGRDHTTVIHACKKVGSQLKVDSDLSKDYQELIKNLCH